MPIVPLAPLNRLLATGGPVLGLRQDGVRLFRGIPFAAPPVGERRFLPPAPPAPWKEPLDCTRFRPSSLQGNPGERTIRHSEDCLYLNLWAPEEGENLPVLVFIHGGGFSDGSPAQRMFDGTAFAKNGVVQVNITYRLGALGFMAFPEVEAAHGNLGNCGLLDQIAALGWVRENIAAFGGNPDNVTICGESAGSYSVSCLMVSPLAKGLFRRAILESGNLLGQPIVSPRANGSREQAVSASARYMRSLGAKDLVALRRLSGPKLAAGAAFRLNMTSPPVYNFWPVFDGHVLPKNPFAALKADGLNCDEMLAGFNADEGTLFIPPTAGEEAYVQLVDNVFGRQGWQVLDRYPVDKKHPGALRARELVKMGLRFGSDVFADELAARGGRAWYYTFDYAGPALEIAGLGSMHALELPFVFATVPRPLLAVESVRACVEFVHKAWLGFVRGGDPNAAGAKGKKPWPGYTAGGKEMMVIDAAPRPGKAPDTGDVAFYRRLLWEGA
ncbi:carboxylesterase family protein [Ruminococcaceae bacterium OttesenSCG-928-A11]|nr:carboxylesterase family protein [Ruminococcaceae bacterium OttesenSCG-928-A11]